MITLNEALTANNFEHTSLKNRDNSPLRVRRNGNTKTWKRNPDQFKIPVKYGLYEYSYIDNNNCHLWNIATN